MVFRETPPPSPPPQKKKLRFFHELQKVFLSFTPSYLLKVTKFLVKISQLEFLVMTEQSIHFYKHFLSLNIPDFSLFFI